jgi:ABC-type polysaccharide/polyol phosphate export permease
VSELVIVTPGLAPSPLRLIATGLRDVWTSRRLVRSLVTADLNRTGANTLLGNIWWLLDPLLRVGVYLVLVGIILGAREPDHALFLMVAVIPWRWFSSTMTDASAAIVGRERLLRQAYFPRLALPISGVVTGLVHMAFALAVTLGFEILFFPVRVTPAIGWLPIVMVVQLAFTIGLALLCAALTVFFRDLGNLLSHALRLWWYLSPGLWTMDRLDGAVGGAHPALSTALHANPMAALLGAWRDVLYSGVAPDFGALGAVLALSVVLIVFGILVFKRLEPAFAKVL